MTKIYISADTIVYKLMCKCLLRTHINSDPYPYQTETQVFFSRNCTIFQEGGFLSSTFADRIILEMEICTLTWSRVIEYADIDEDGENTEILITLIPRATAAEDSGWSTPQRNYETNVETTSKTWWNKGKSRLRIRLGQTELWTRGGGRGGEGLSDSVSARLYLCMLDLTFSEHAAPRRSSFISSRRD